MGTAGGPSSLQTLALAQPKGPNVAKPITPSGPGGVQPSTAGPQRGTTPTRGPAGRPQAHHSRSG